ncbi:MAG TPA: hypothetical protein VN493_22585 [Thermoanaerobaculia bacterium]|nr:hypothetical protein [Thermoanaerobaculia bacterium]
MHNAAFADLNRSWSHLATSVAITRGLPPLLQTDRKKLDQALKEAREAERRQLAHRAAAQQATRDLEAAKRRAHDAAMRIRCGLWSHYGKNSEVLHAFGMRPYPYRGVRTTGTQELPDLERLGRQGSAAGGGGGPLPTVPGRPRGVGEPLPNRDAKAVVIGEHLPGEPGLSMDDGEPLPVGPEPFVPAGERLPSEPESAIREGEGFPHEAGAPSGQITAGSALRTPRCPAAPPA